MVLNNMVTINNDPTKYFTEDIMKQFRTQAEKVLDRYMQQDRCS